MSIPLASAFNLCKSPAGRNGFRALGLRGSHRLQEVSVAGLSVALEGCEM